MSDNPTTTEERRQGLGASLATKFATVYFGLWFVLVSGLPYQGALVNALARLLGIATPVPNVESGSGDRLYDWLSMGVFLVVAVLGTVLWGALDRRRKNDRTNVEILRVFLRYGLGAMILSYGFAKTSQFPVPSSLELAKPLGQGTPMALLWNFMGASFAYSLFAGVLEIVGGVLLLFRRTTLLGAAVFAPVMLNVFVLNVCYDVPVKLYSFHALLGALILLAPDARRLFDLFVLNRPVPPREIGPPVRYRKLRTGVLVVKWLAILGLAVVPGVQNFAQGWQARSAPQGPLAGAWNVSRFAGQGSPWTKAVVIENPSASMIVLRTQDGKEWRAFVDDDKKGTIHLKGKDGTNRQWAYRLSPPDALSVQEGGTTVELRRDRAEFPLMRHRMHLIQAQPRTPLTSKRVVRVFVGLHVLVRRLALGHGDRRHGLVGYHASVSHRVGADRVRVARRIDDEAVVVLDAASGGGHVAVVGRVHGGLVAFAGIGVDEVGGHGLKLFERGGLVAFLILADSVGVGIVGARGADLVGRVVDHL